MDDDRYPNLLTNHLVDKGDGEGWPVPQLPIPPIPRFEQAPAAPNSPSPMRDLDRILILPKRQPVDCERERGADGRPVRRWTPEAQALIDVMTAKYSLGPRECKCRELGYEFCITEFNPAQAWILRELPRVGGIFGMISAGFGKTLAGILAPLALPSVRTWALFIKPDQRFHYRKNYLRAREHFRVPSIVFDNATLQGSYIVPGTPVLHVIPYSLLSNPKSTTLLEQLDPDGLILDESHLVAAKTSSRTVRLLRYLTRRNNEGRAVVQCNWSGSTIKKTMKDASHLAAHSLGMGSPYPLDPDEVEAWSVVIDPSPVPDTTSSTAKALHKVFGEALNDRLPIFGHHASTKVREGHRDRIIQTPGVVSTRSSSVNCSLTIRERVPPAMPEVVKTALSGVRNDWVRPDGEELVEALQQTECAREVACGFYSYWAFIHGEPDELIEEWYAARKAWNKELRVKLRHGEPHLDSPMLCANAAERAWRQPRYIGDLPVWPADSWPAWAKIKDKVQPDPRTKWLDDWLARDAAEWTKSHKGIVWCQSRAFGKRVAEIAGINYHGGGPEAEARILAEDGKRAIVASIPAHGTGRDLLQARFSEQLVAEIPASGDGWEQLLARLAREGQQADTVETDVFLHASEIKDAMRKAVMYSEFIQSTTPNRLLLLSADCSFEL